MSDQNHSAAIDDAIFYVDEGGEDFTFYLARHKKNDKEEQSDPDLKGRLKFCASTDQSRDTEFSFSQKIRTITLALTRKCLKDTANDLEQFRSLKQARFEYLFERIEELRCINPEAGDSFLVQTALNDLIKRGELTGMSWVATISDDERQFLDCIPVELRKRWEDRLSLHRTFPEILEPHSLALTKPIPGRGIFCLTHGGEYISVTFRRLREGAGYKAEEYSPENEEDKRKKYLFSIGEYCQRIYEEVFIRTNSKEHAHGLLVITGSTKSGKSEITRGLIYKHLECLAGATERPPHLVTFEDPIETPFFEPPPNEGEHGWNAMVQMPPTKTALNYTPREKDKDVGLLRKALEDALRQTPAVFFVGETRRKAEWELLLDFASTGHLIVTTAHAGSLVEAMHKIFEARRVKTPSDRGEIANKLLAVVHLGNDSIRISEDSQTRVETNVLFPALWRRTSRGIAALTCDGLASLLPHRPDKTGEDPPSCLGRRWLVQQLIEPGSDPKPRFPCRLEAIKTNVYRRATEWDLSGV